MGIYVLVTLTLDCDNCAHTIGKMVTAKDDVPIYVRAKMYCSTCIEAGHAGELASTNTKEVMAYINDEILKAERHTEGSE